jgi:hypothetical protein
VLDDARNYIATTDEEFSVIVTDVTNLKYKRNPYLYTREYFELMRDALSADGVAAAWLPVGGLSFNDLRTLIATFDSVFPNTTAWYFTQFPTHFIILVGTPEPTLVNLEELKEKTADVERDLRGLSVDNVYELASMLLLGESDIDSLVDGAPIRSSSSSRRTCSRFSLGATSSLPSSRSISTCIPAITSTTCDFTSSSASIRHRGLHQALGANRTSIMFCGCRSRGANRQAQPQPCGLVSMHGTPA